MKSRKNRTYTIGRDPDNFIVINNDDVSRFHLDINVKEDGKLSVTDRGSKNFSFIHRDGEIIKISGEIGLKRNDVIQVGNSFRISALEIKDLVENGSQSTLSQNINTKDNDKDSTRVVTNLMTILKSEKRRCLSCGEVVKGDLKTIIINNKCPICQEQFL